MSDARQSHSPSGFAIIAERLGILSHEQATALEKAAEDSGVEPWRYALENGGLDSASADIIKTLMSPAESIPGYEVLDLIGRGGMGVVYRARQLSLDRQVALKTILLSQLSNPNAAQRFEKEAQVLARLTHPHIVGAFDFGRTSGRVFLAMELVEGTDTERLLSKYPDGLPEYFTLQIIRQAAMGLAHASEVDVIHRDIKPANLLLVTPPNGFPLPVGIPLVKIADFGLSILGDDQLESRARLTSANVHLGSPTYMAPEQLESAEVSHSVDIFSLGATAWHMLTGKPPLQGSLRQIVLSRVSVPTDLLDAHVSHLNSETVGLVREMLEIDPKLRIDSYSNLIHRIDEISNQFQAQAMPALPAEIFRPQISNQLPTAEFRSSQTSKFPIETMESSEVTAESPASPPQLLAVRGSTSASRWTLGIAIATGLLLLGIWIASSLLRDDLPARQDMLTGLPLALFDGKTLSNWVIRSGNWSPALGSEGGAVLQGTDGSVDKYLGSIAIDSLPDFAAFEVTLQMLTAQSSGVEVRWLDKNEVITALAINIDGDQITVFSASAATPQEVIQASQLKAGGDLVGIRLEWQQTAWWILVNGETLAHFPSSLSALERLRLTANAGQVHFSDLSIAALREATPESAPIP